MFVKENCLSTESLNRLESLLEDYNKKLIQKSDEPQPAFNFHYSNRDLLRNLRDIFKDVPEITGALSEKSYIVTRKVTPKDSKLSFMAHFDNYKTTILVPIKVPKHSLNGDIVVWSKARPMPKNVYTHVLTKLLFQNPFSKFFFKIMHNKKIKFERHTVKPGSIAKFDGFVDFHFNLPVADEVRFSLLIHNEKMFENSFLVRLVEKYSQYLVAPKKTAEKKT
jgi:hypothetical protein